MKVFVIPSWYPTKDYPTVGVFYYEQVRLLARVRPDWQIGVSLWGSHEPGLWVRPVRPVHALFQLASPFPIKRYEKIIGPNLVEFFHPAFTWTRKVFEGNIKGITLANEQNLDRYIQVFGKPDVIHAHIAYPAGYAARALSSRFNIPYLVTEQMSPFPLPDFNKDFRKYILPPLQQADIVLSVGENLSKTLSSYGISSVLTSNFIDMDRFSLQKPGNEIPTLFALGRLEDQKGFDLLLEALAGLKSLAWYLNLGGTGAMGTMLKKMADRLGISDRVTFLGQLEQSEVAEHVQACDFFVLSSRHESFGVVLIEALACGKPVVFTRCGGLTGLLPDLVGLACEVDVGSLQNAIKKMLKGYAEYDGQNLRDYVLNNHSPEIVAKQLESIYRRIMEREADV